MTRLRNGQRLPDILAVGADGEPVTLPDMVAGSWAAILLYRGHW